MSAVCDQVLKYPVPLVVLFDTRQFAKFSSISLTVGHWPPSLAPSVFVVSWQTRTVRCPFIYFFSTMHFDIFLRTSILPLCAHKVLTIVHSEDFIMCYSDSSICVVCYCWLQIVIMSLDIMFLTNDNLRRMRKEPLVLGLRYRVRILFLFHVSIYINVWWHRKL